MWTKAFSGNIYVKRKLQKDIDTVLELGIKIRLVEIQIRFGEAVTIVMNMTLVHAHITLDNSNKNWPTLDNIGLRTEHEGFM